MHIRDGILGADVCVVTGALATAAVGYSLHRMSRERVDHALPATGAVAALIFAGQMVNFPLPGLAVSGHLLGGALAAALIGPWAGCVALTVVLLVQAVLFADGGLMAFGANVLNMAVVGCWGSAAIMQGLQRVWGAGLVARSAAAVVAAATSLMIAAACVCIEGGLSRNVMSENVPELWRLMLSYHLGVAIGEAILTGATLAVIHGLQTVWASNTHGRQFTGGGTTLVIGAAACLIAVALAPLASEFPDGLEAVGEHLQFNALAHDHMLILPDYELPLPAGWNSWAVSAAGLVGACVVWACGSSIERGRKWMTVG